MTVEMRTFVFILVILLMGCGANGDHHSQSGDPTVFQARFRGLEPGDTQEKVRSALGEPHDVTEWTVAVPMWGPGESLANELPVGYPVETWSYTVDAQVHYLHFDRGTASMPLLSKEIHPEGAVF